ncbi:hypothetical protein BZZ01_32775 (plasmid) [Nostocales cyanobacterium HT-58-2]|nr:hypothetical protein BZZ01_32775 [Nostocales cyanobacterium HT-58-2]
MSDFLSRLEQENQVIWYPNQSETEFLEEVTRMLAVVRMQEDFLRGSLDADVLLDFLDEQEFDVYKLSDDCFNPC